MLIKMCNIFKWFVSPYRIPASDTTRVKSDLHSRTTPSYESVATDANITSPMSGWHEVQFYTAIFLIKLNDMSSRFYIHMILILHQNKS